MSPVRVLVAVVVTQMLAGRLIDGANEMAAFPWPFVVTVVEPIGVCPWPKPEGSGIKLVKNWIKKGVLAMLASVP